MIADFRLRIDDWLKNETRNSKIASRRTNFAVRFFRFRPREPKEDRAPAISTDVHHFPWPDGGHGLTDFFANRFVVSKAVSGNLYDHDSKFE